MRRLNLVKDYFGEIKEYINELIKENGSEMYEGVFDLINELENDDNYWVEYINELEEEYIDDDDDFIDMVLVDSVDRNLMREFGKKFGENLKKLGYKYDGEGWDIKDKNGKEVTCYGFVWDYWYDLDTCVREMVSDIFEECCEE
jgi:hypothetical protein